MRHIANAGGSSALHKVTFCILWRAPSGVWHSGSAHALHYSSLHEVEGSNPSTSMFFTSPFGQSMPNCIRRIYRPSLRTLALASLRYFCSSPLTCEPGISQISSARRVGKSVRGVRTHACCTLFVLRTASLRRNSRQHGRGGGNMEA